jgi:AraC family transcriptional regulator of adaptative response/methylated-DNA-[protein]-cysteine methyltransferase
VTSIAQDIEQRDAVDAVDDNDELRWAAVQRRDPAFDGLFYYSVRTTGVYCRPSCPSRAAGRANVAFHASAIDAEAAGFRPCLRCAPHLPPLAERQREAVARVCRLIDAADDVSGHAPDLDSLAQAAGMSRYHFHRVFKAHTGITPRAYAAARRGERVRQELAQGAPVLDAIYDAGYGSSTRFYAGSRAVLGMLPAQYRSGGRGKTIRFAVGQCSLGAILVAATDRGICAILMGDEPAPLVDDLQVRFPHAVLEGADSDFALTVAQVVGLVEAPRIGLDLPLDVRGTAFQQRVWQALRTIPAGRTVSYAELAEIVGVAGGARAVAGACAANPAAVAIPCHRVVRVGGALSGYRWGIERKRTLLEREQTQEHERASSTPD